MGGGVDKKTREEKPQGEILKRTIKKHVDKRL